jgi:hypothetical protein
MNQQNFTFDMHHTKFDLVEGVNLQSSVEVVDGG